MGDEVFLIGATDQNITLIASVDPGEQAVIPVAAEPSLNFSNILRAHGAENQDLSHGQLRQPDQFPAGQEN